MKNLKVIKIDGTEVKKQINDNINISSLITSLKNSTDSENILSIYVDNEILYLKEIYLLSIVLEFDDDEYQLIEEDSEYEIDLTNEYYLDEIYVHKLIIKNNEIDISLLDEPILEQYIGEPISNVIPVDEIIVNDDVTEVLNFDEIQNIGFIPQLQVFFITKDQLNNLLTNEN